MVLPRLAALAEVAWNPAGRTDYDDFVDRILVCRSRFESPDVDGEIVVNYAPELFGGVRGEDLCGRFIDVKITGADEYDLIAEPIK